MAFFEELGKTIVDKSKVVVDKAKDMTGVIQLKSQISSERATIEETYTKIGKAYFEAHNNQTEDPYMDEFNQIRSRLQKIQSLEEEIARLEGTRICAECGARVDKASLFCGQCGAKMAYLEPEKEKEEANVPAEEAGEEAVPTEEAGEAETAVPTEEAGEEETVSVEETKEAAEE